METIDPLVSALKFFQADADNREAPESISFVALNNAIQANDPAGYINGEEFARRFEEDPTLQQYVDGYDENGVRLKTIAPQQPPSQEPEITQTPMDSKPSGNISSMAKKAAKRGLKK
jgi:hypothetical protein